jgi:hypothetical protein
MIPSPSPTSLCRFESPLEIAMSNFVKRLNAKCRGEPVEDDNSLPITTEAIQEGGKLGGETSSAQTSPLLIKKASSLRPMSRILEDELSDTTPDTDTISTDFSHPRSAFCLS